MDAVKTILLTGATGYLGSKLAMAFAAADYNLVILKRQSSNTKRIDALEGKFKSYDIDQFGCKQAFEENKIDCIIHTAASYGRKGETLSEIYDANLVFPVKLLDNCLKHGVKYFLNTGTCLPENLNAYALSKAQFLALLKQQRTISTVNVELQHFYGPGDDETKFITFVLSKMLSGASSIDLSEGTQSRDFVYIDDVVSAYLLLLQNFGKQERHFLNVPLGSGNAYTLRSMVEKIKEHTKSNISLNFGVLPMRDGDVMYAKADIQILEKLGWRPKFDINKGLTETIST
jgi:CDP-paratose synthetase